MNAFRDGAVVDLAEGVARFEAETACKIYFTQFSVMEHFHGGFGGSEGTILEADLYESFVLAGGFDHFTTFIDIVAGRFFAKNIFASFAKTKFKDLELLFQFLQK